MKEGWEVKKLGDVCEILDYLRKPVTKKDRREGIYPYYGASGIQDYVDTYIFDGRYLLVGEDGAKWGASDKSAYIIEGKSWVNNHAHILKVNDEIIDKLIEYYLVFKDLSEYITGAIVPKLTQQALRSIPIPIPPLPEQSRIVEELDLLSNTIEKKRQQLSELDNLAQSIFYDMFILKYEQWERMALIDIYKFIDYRGKTPNKIDYGVPLITARNIRKGYIDYTVKEFISETEFQCRQSRGIAQKGDLLFTTEAPMGYAAIADLDTFSTGQRLITFQQRNEGVVSNIYVLYYILSDMFQTELNKQATGATVKGIKGSKLEKMIVPLPPLNIQQLFAQKIEAIEKEKELIKQSIKETEELLNSRMDYYFIS